MGNISGKSSSVPKPPCRVIGSTKNETWHPRFHSNIHSQLTCLCLSMWRCLCMAHLYDAMSHADRSLYDVMSHADRSLRCFAARDCRGVRLMCPVCHTSAREQAPGIRLPSCPRMAHCLRAKKEPETPINTAFPVAPAK